MMKLFGVVWCCLLIVVCSVQLTSSAINYPVLLVPGLGGSVLFSHQTATDPVPGCTIPQQYMWVDVSFVLTRTHCFAEAARLVYNNVTHTTHNIPGIDVSTGHYFGSVDTIMDLDPRSVLFKDFLQYYGPMVRMLQSHGYQKDASGFNLAGAPYDFRRTPHDLTEWVSNVTSLIESLSQNSGGAPVVVVGHSMGNPMMLYVYNQMAKAWKDRYIHAHVSLSGVWGGTAKAVRVLTSGDNVGVMTIDSLTVRPAERSFPSIHWFMPSDRFWGSNEVLVQTPGKNYTVRDYQQLYDDMDFSEGYMMWQDNKHLVYDLKAPEVEVHCLYGYDVKTEDSFQYGPNTFPDHQPDITYGDGDGTVNLRSLQGCLRWAGQQKEPVYHVPLQKVPHVKIIHEDSVFQYLLNVLFPAQKNP